MLRYNNHQMNIIPIMQVKDGVNMSDDESLEKEAEVMGAKAGGELLIKLT
jgi:hypothetical protein